MTRVNSCHIIKDYIKFIICSFGAYHVYDENAAGYEHINVTFRKKN